jgi:putative ABC transport system permease protein
VVIGWGLVAALLVLTAVAVTVVRLAGLGPGREMATAAARAAVQLAAVSAVIVGVVRHLGLAVAFVLVMFAVAAYTSARRITGHRSGFAAGASIAAGVVPALDQTRTVGLVTLPGAFVGVLLGSGDPVQAGAAQLLVLVALLAAEAIAVALTVELVARGRIRRP